MRKQLLTEKFKLLARSKALRISLSSLSVLSVFRNARTLSSVLLARDWLAEIAFLNGSERRKKSVQFAKETWKSPRLLSVDFWKTFLHY